MKRLTLALAIVVGLAACGQKQQPAAPMLAVEDAVIRIAPVEGRPAAGYFSLRGGKQSDRLISISSPRVATIELHETQMTHGMHDMMAMKPLTGVDVPAGATVAFKPGGNHAMLFGIDPSVKRGNRLALHFSFQSGKTIDVEAETIAAGDAMPVENAR